MQSTMAHNAPNKSSSGKRLVASILRSKFKIGIEPLENLLSFEKSGSVDHNTISPTSFITSVTYESGLVDYEEFPHTESPVWILGKQYSVLYDLEDIKHDVNSRLWFTYRRGFDPIGGVGPTCDTGWGCMLRCGQMMLAQALICRHLSREWRWQPEKYDPKYYEILRMFVDKRAAYYSIQVIASMGTTEGKSVGEWFGPNTISQVLKKLAVSDEWSSVVMHVALDNTIIIDDINQLCLTKSSKHKLRTSPSKSPPDGSQSIVNGHTPSGLAWGNEEEEEQWRPLLLVLPLRLGLSEINPVYVNALKRCLTFKQSTGIIGGKPSHAHWFIGYLEDEFVYLDPHTTQPFTDVTSPTGCDETYHCPYISRMRVHNIDPSVAVGFFCKTQADFVDLCTSIRKFILNGEKTAMFELHQHRPPHWPPFESQTSQGSSGPASADFSMVEAQFDSDDEFELIPHPDSFS